MEEGLVLVDTNIIIEVLKNNKEIIDAKPERFQVHRGPGVILSRFLNLFICFFICVKTVLDETAPR